VRQRRARQPGLASRRVPRLIVATEIVNNRERFRYELHLDGRLVGIADYRLAGDVVSMPHTEIVPAMRHQGHGARLVKAALDDIRGQGRTVVPYCWFVAQFIDENPDYADLLAA
jgi:uncharacterized protein